MGINGLYANGTAWATTAYATTGATIDFADEGETISADWIGSGAAFQGSNLLSSTSKYVLNIDSPDAGVTGTVTLQSVST